MEETKFKALKHDEIFRQSLENIIEAKEFIKANIPSDIVSKIDLNTLKLSKDTFIEEDMKKSLCDVLFSVQFQGHEGYLYFICEHQSTVDNLIAFRLLKYIVNIIDLHIKNTNKSNTLPPVYATVLYNGESKYTAPTKITDLFHHKDIMLDFFMNGYNLIDLNSFDDKELHKANLACINALIMKNIHKRKKDKDLEFVIYVLKMIRDLSNKYDKDVIDNLIRRLMCYYDINKQEMIVIENEVTDMQLARFAQESYDEGLIHGIEKGINTGEHKKAIEVAKKALESGLDFNTIIKITGLTMEEIESIKH